MVKKTFLIVKIIISLILIGTCILLGYLAFSGKYKTRREVIDTVISDDGAHKAIVTKIINSYEFDDTIEFTILDNDGRRNAIFVDTVYGMNWEAEGYDIELGQEQVIISVKDQLENDKAYKIVVDYNDLAGRDVIEKDYLSVIDPIYGITWVLFVVSIILLMFSKKRKTTFVCVSLVLLIINIFFMFGFSTGHNNLRLNDVIYEEGAAEDQNVSLKNSNYEIFQNRLNKVHVFYHSSEQGNITLSTYASGKIDNTKIDVDFLNPNSASISIQGEDSFAFTVVRE